MQISERRKIDWMDFQRINHLKIVLNVCDIII